MTHPQRFVLLCLRLLQLVVDGARGGHLMYTVSLLPVEITVNVLQLVVQRLVLLCLRLLQLVVDGDRGGHLTSTFSLLPVVVAQTETGVVTNDFANAFN
jgi:hypothetical protein